MEKIGIVVNSKKPNAEKWLGELQAWLAKRSIEMKDTVESPIEDVIKEASLLVCLGGDGTILRIANHMKERSIPVLAVNIGSLGFLTEVKTEEMFDELQTYFLNKSKIEERLMLSCSVKSDNNRQERRFQALNDIVISREGLTRLLSVRVDVAGETLTNFSGDGVIVATPTGSTAYSLSAGGAIVHPKLEAIIVTPICPHALALRSLVVRADERVSIQIHTERDGEKALLTSDGQESMEVDQTSTIEITKSTIPFRLVKSSRRSYVETLRENFKLPI
ncbi:MAG: NAD(+)/NADH kinase [Candidatus Omnitrophica bacterium]|nr:NAD(+)/NADH kinase [Candidatus Omnitrophota bacterium]